MAANDERTRPALHHRRGGAGEPLVLMHGLGLSLRSWEPVLGELERSHDVLALDLPGFGDSDPLPAGARPGIPGLCDAVEAQLDACGWDAAHLAGNSLGGWIALELARRGRARSAVAISPAGAWTPRERAYSTALLRAQKAVAGPLAPHARLVVARAPGRTLAFGVASARPWRIRPDAAASLLRSYATAPGFRPTLDWMASNRLERVDELRAPVLIAWGTRDVLLPPRQGPRLVGRLPNAELRPLPGLGHVPMADDPVLVARAILDFTRAPARDPRPSSS